ncbi:MAG: hypothetical protein SF182_19645 [Deltaproteobacteria bacterium]|nr:hypothetical protein [Deltaproteobacteria bacterium]
MHSTPPGRLWWYAAFGLALLVRVPLLAEKPFWRDEAWVATLVEAPLTRVVDGQPRPVPLGFLTLARATRVLPLSPEVAYRLPSLACGLALLPALAALAVALGARGVVPLVVTWLAAGLPALVYYSRELKPYGFDALLAALAPLLALHLFGRAAGPQLAPRRAGAALLAALVAAPWFSFGAVFAIAALLAWGWLAWWRGAAPAARRWWIAASVAFAASLALCFRVALAAQSTSPTLRSTWRSFRFVDAPGSLVAHAADALWRYASLSITFVFPDLWWVAVPLVALGALTWARGGRALLGWMMVVPGLAAVGAALADRYLLAHGRLLLFGAPPLILAAAAGLVLVCHRLSPARGPHAALAASAALAIAWSTAALAHRLPPLLNHSDYFRYDTVHEVAPLIDAVAPHLAAGDPVFIAQYATKASLYYGRGRVSQATLCREPCDLRAGLQEWARSLRSRGWLIVTDDERTTVDQVLDAAGISPRLARAARGAALLEVQPGG